MIGCVVRRWVGELVRRFSDRWAYSRTVAYKSLKHPPPTLSRHHHVQAIDTRLELLASLLEQGDALKLKRKTSESLEQQLKGHYEAFNACKRTFFEAKQLKKVSSTLHRPLKS